MSDKKEIILVAEDSPPNRKILGHLLKKLNYNVIECPNGQEAWDSYLKEESVDGLVAIFSDIMMPSMDGLGLLKNVRKTNKYKDTPFVLITAVSNEDYIVQAKSFNVSGYILKPITFQRITTKLKELFPSKNFSDLAS